MCSAIKVVTKPKSLAKIKEISDILNLLQKKNNVVNKQELLISSAELWSTLMVQTYTTKKSQRPAWFKNETLKVETPDEVVDLLLSLADTSDQTSWNTFDLFWVPIAGSPLALEIVPKLITKATLASPNLGFDILMRIDNDQFFPRIDKFEPSQYWFQKSRYTKSIFCGLNAFLHVLMQAEYLDHANLSKHWNLMYDAFDQLNTNIETINILPHVAQTLTSRIPRHAYADFYAILLLRRANLQSTHFRKLPEYLLFNGTDAEKSLVLNADKLLGANQQKLAPIFSLKTYSAILNHLGRKPTETNNENATWFLDNIVTKHAAQPTKLLKVLDTVLRRATDSGDMAEAAGIYEYMLQKDHIEPSITTYANLFRGFRRLAPTIGDFRCFEVLNLIHLKGLAIPPFLCTEILALINDRYHGLVVFQFYKAYFGDEHLHALGIADYFESLYVPNIEKPDYTPSIHPDTTAIQSEVHQFNSVALAILYSAALRSVSTIAQVLELYKHFREFQHFPCKAMDMLSVYDYFVSTLCTKFNTNESLVLAKSILEDLAESVLLPLKDNPLPIRRPLRYSGPQLKGYSELTKAFVEKGNIIQAEAVAELALLSSPFVHGDLFVPLIQYHLANRNNPFALHWMDRANSVGAIITNHNEMVQIVEQYRQDLAELQASKEI